MKRLFLIITTVVVLFSSVVSCIPAPIPMPAPVPTPTPTPAPVPEPVPEPLPTPVPQPTPALAPAPVPTPTPQEFEAISLEILPSEIVAGEIATIKADITNIGGTEGEYAATLLINGVEEATSEMVLDAGATQTISFEFVREAAGIYKVEIDGRSGTLVVQGLPQLQPEELGQIEYDIEQEFTLTNEGPGVASRVRLLVALIKTREPYQTVTSIVMSPDDYETIEDKYGNTFAQFEFVDMDVRDVATVKITYHVAIRRLSYTNNLGACEEGGRVPTKFLEPEQWIEADAEEIEALAKQITEAQSDSGDKARAIYDWVGDNIDYSGYCGDDRGALFALNNMAGDCSEFSDLLAALSRAVGIPVRAVEGITLEKPGSPVVHGWVEVYLGGIGWIPADPTWGRFAESRDKYFAKNSPYHVIVSKGRNLDILNGFHYWLYNYWWKGQETCVSVVQNWYVKTAMPPKPDGLLTSDDDYYRLWTTFYSWGANFNTLYDTYSEEGLTKNWDWFWIGSDDDDNKRVYFDRVGDKWRPRSIPSLE